MSDVAFVDYAFEDAVGTTARTLPDRLKDVVNVKDWGAVGNGVTDDRQAIQDAINWNSILLTTTAHAYSGAFRCGSSSWAGGIWTLHLTEPHGWTVPSSFAIKLEQFSAPAVTLDGNYTATVTDADTITVPLAAEPIVGYYGHVRPQVISATWAANLVTLTFAAAHRIGSGTSCTIAGFVDAAINGTRAVTSTGTTTLTFAVTGSGAISTMGTCKPLPVLTFASVPTGSISGTTSSYLAGRFPTTSAQHYGHSVSSSTATTTTLSFPLQADIPNGTQVRFAGANRGRIFFPPGEYLINGPLYYDDASPETSHWLGVPGKSIIRAGPAGGGFSGYMVIQNLKVASNGPTLFEKLAFVNEHASGGCLRLCQVNTQVRDCVFEANKCIDYSSDDYIAAISFSVEVNGCRFSPGAAPSGSIGILLGTNNASVVGNYVAGFDEGFRAWSFGKTISGNVFKDNGIGIRQGVVPPGTQRASTYSVITGNAFINNGIAYSHNVSTGNTRVEGNYIEGGPDAATGFSFAADSQINLIRGIDIAGDFTNRAFEAVGTSLNNRWNQIRAVRAVNDAGTDWTLPTKPHNVRMTECNEAKIYTFSQLEGWAISSIAWAAGIVTITTPAAHGLVGTSPILHVSGVTVGGSLDNNYNGVFASSSAATATTFKYALAANPGAAAASTGNVHTGSSGVNNNKPLKSLTWASNEALAETWGVHLMTPGSGITVAGVTGGTGFNGTYAAAVITITGAATFKYALTPDPGAAGGFAASIAATVETGARCSISHQSVSNPNMLEGAEYGISDGAKLGGGTAVIGDRVQGAGAQHIKVRYTRNGWVRAG